MRTISEQRGAAQCQVCQSWFRSRGRLAVHTVGADWEASATEISPDEPVAYRRA